MSERRERLLMALAMFCVLGVIAISVFWAAGRSGGHAAPDQPPGQRAFLDQVAHANRAATQHEVEAVLQGYRVETTDGAWDRTAQGEPLKRHAIRRLWVNEKEGTGEGDFSAAFYFDDSYCLVGSEVFAWMR